MTTHAKKKIPVSSRFHSPVHKMWFQSSKSTCFQLSRLAPPVCSAVRWFPSCFIQRCSSFRSSICQRRCICPNWIQLQHVSEDCSLHLFGLTVAQLGGQSSVNPEVGGSIPGSPDSYPHVEVFITMTGHSNYGIAKVKLDK